MNAARQFLVDLENLSDEAVLSVGGIELTPDQVQQLDTAI
jgi:hypothetical protein